LFSSEYINQAKKENNLEDQFNGYYSKQMVFAKNKLHQKSIDACNTMLLFADKHNLNEALFKAYHYKSKAIYSVKNSMNINIIENLTEALKVTQLKNNTYWESKFLNDIAYFHLLSKNYSEAKK